jgi:cobalt-precorrin 5A hydrolase
LKQQADLPCVVYAPEKYSQKEAVPLDKKLDVFVKEIYPKVDAFVGVMATGIIIRAVAPYLEGKLVDPAVIGVDASGKFVISLLSGHYGGANFLTKIIAEGIGATPVITTASDAMGKQSVDELARILHLIIVNPESLVAVNSAIVNGERLALVLVGNVKIPTDAACGYTVEKAENVEQAVEIMGNYDAGAIVTQKLVEAKVFSKPVTILKPKKIIMGLGARKEVTQDQVLKAINTALSRANLPLERVDGLATVDIKKDTLDLVSAAQKLGLNLEFLTVAELGALKHEDLSPDSKLVEETIGVGGVCERAAIVKAGKNAHLILKKQKLNGVTVAIAEGE